MLARNARDVGSSPALGTVFSHFHHTHDTGCYEHDPIQATCCMIVKLPCVCICAIAYMNAIVNIKRLTILGGQV